MQNAPKQTKTNERTNKEYQESRHLQKLYLVLTIEDVGRQRRELVVVKPSASAKGKSRTDRQSSTRQHHQ